jgi:hypothetical protein
MTNCFAHIKKHVENFSIVWNDFSTSAHNVEKRLKHFCSDAHYKVTHKKWPILPGKKSMQSFLKAWYSNRNEFHMTVDTRLMEHIEIMPRASSTKSTQTGIHSVLPQQASNIVFKPCAPSRKMTSSTGYTTSSTESRTYKLMRNARK